MRVGTGPVFAYERVAAARRWHLYAGRSILVAALLAAMAIIAGTQAMSDEELLIRLYARIGESYFYGLIGVELAIVMLAAPAATAGAICVDRARGNLALMMATDLSDAEIVLGKLGARLLPVLGLVAASWPVMAITTLLGGIDPTALTAAFAIILTVAVLGCTMALALSVWAKKTHEVLMATYTALGLALLAYPVWLGLSRSRAIAGPPLWLLHANPVYLAYAPYWAPGTIEWSEYAWFFGATAVTSAVLTLLAVWRVRPATVREAGRRARGSGTGLVGRIVRALPAPSIEADPVLWREWHRSRPSPWMLLFVGLLIGTTTACCAAGAAAMFVEGVQPNPGSLFKYAGVYGYMLQVFFGLLMFSAIAPTALSEERQRGSLDVVLATPLSTRAIVRGKWWGTYRLIPLLALGPTIMAYAMAFGPLHPGGWPFAMEERGAAELSYGFLLMPATLLIHGTFLTSLGLVLATWIPRQSRAMAMSVTAYALVAIGWPILYFSVGPRLHPGDPVPALSPIIVCASLADILTIRSLRAGNLFWGTTIWDGLVLVAAAVLFEATVRTFDRRLGRMPEGTGPVATDPEGGQPSPRPIVLGEWEGG